MRRPMNVGPQSPSFTPRAADAADDRGSRETPSRLPSFRGPRIVNAGAAYGEVVAVILFGRLREAVGPRADRLGLVEDASVQRRSRWAALRRRVPPRGGRRRRGATA